MKSLFTPIANLTGPIGSSLPIGLANGPICIQAARWVGRIDVFCGWPVELFVFANINALLSAQSSGLVDG